MDALPHEFRGASFPQSQYERFRFQGGDSGAWRLWTDESEAPAKSGRRWAEPRTSATAGNIRNGRSRRLTDGGECAPMITV